jgi:hypothetical protein
MGVSAAVGDDLAIMGGISFRFGAEPSASRPGARATIPFPMKSNHVLALLLAVGALLLTGCNYDVPLTEKPTRQIDERLLGVWVADNKEDKKEEFMVVRKFDDSTYVVALDHDIYRVFHSDFADNPFLSAQDLNFGDGKYTYYVWQLSADGVKLSLKGVSTKVVPGETKGRAALQKLIKANLANPKLYGDTLVFTLKKR